MSAPIDDLLYGGDDSGDEDDMPDVPMRSFSTPLMANPAAALPLPPAGIAAPLGVTAAVTNAAPILPPASVVASSSTLAIATAPFASTPLRPAAPSILPAGQPLKPAPPAVPVAAAPAKQATGSGQQMFQQMFALLKQMLPAEQYATLHSEMRNGNGNDIKSIVDIIKRIAGDAIFSNVIQKMDLTRTFPPNSTPFGTTMKTEPSSATIPTSAQNSVTSSPGLSRPLAARTGVTPPAATSSALPIPSTIAAAPVTGVSALVAGASNSTTAAVQRPALPQAIKPPHVDTSASIAPAPAVIKPEPTDSSSASSTPSTKNEALEKIQFAKKLLFHASTCVLSPGVCQVKKCDDVRRVFKHSASCGGARGCSHCEQLKGLVKFHAKECAVSVTEHCTIPFCDGLRRAYASAAKPKTEISPSSLASKFSTSVTSDDDDDNTPLSSAVNKAKKNATKSKSPRTSPVVRPTTASPSAASLAAAKKKASPVSITPSKPTYISSTSSTTTPVTTTAAAAAAAAAKAAPPKTGPTANMTIEYGRLLQLILHVQKCTTSVCPVGEECAESKALLRQINLPNAPARAKTYKQVYSHYKVCLAKNNTGNCPMCKIGLRPILPETTSLTPLESPENLPVANGSGSTLVTSPSVASLKRTNSTVAPSPRSPSKKPRSNSTSRVKAATPLPDPSQSGDLDQAVGFELSQASVNDIRREADVLTHTGIDLGSERRAMMEVASGKRQPIREQLPCKKEEWAEKDLFNTEILQRQMQECTRRNGVHMGAHTSEVMSYALHEYLKQVVEEMVEISKQRGDMAAQLLDQVQKKEPRPAGASSVELTATDILRVSCEHSFTRLRQEDLSLRARLLEDAKRDEVVEKERAKKRKKVDRTKLLQDEKDEAEMDIEEFAIKDLKERLLQDDKDGVVKVDGRVNESISSKFVRRLDNQVTIEDANYWLQSQKPYLNPKLFVRAEAARIVTNSLL